MAGWGGDNVIVSLDLGFYNVALPQSCADRVDVGQLDSLSIHGLRILNMQEMAAFVHISFPPVHITKCLFLLRTGNK